MDTEGKGREEEVSGRAKGAVSFPDSLNPNATDE